MPPERDLAAEFGVARNTVGGPSDCCRKDGAVSRGKSAAAPSSSPPMPTRWPAPIKRMEGASPADMMEIRELLEPAAAAFAATNASAGEIEAVREAHLAACDAIDMPGFEHWDAEFHHRIFACSRNDFLREIHNLMRVLRNQAPWFEMKKRSFSEERRQIYCQEHEAILVALSKRDSDSAREAMLQHLKSVGRNLLGR